uniref:Uncharacterized protein n=1 Tax=Oryza punctata TaxID=4537 RepID=A0A0E0MMJ8_ORYPU
MDLLPRPSNRGEGESRAPVLRWLGIGNVSGGLCSRVTRIRGVWWQVKGERERVGTADGGARFRPAMVVTVVACFEGEMKGELVKWDLLV